MSKKRSIIYKTLHPHAYHGPVKRGPFFEGWYFKLVNKDGSRRVSIIPGVYIGRNRSDSHSFIQVLDGSSGNSAYIKYTYEDFSADSEIVKVQIKENLFTSDRLAVNIDQPEMQISGSIKISNSNPWPKNVLSPGIMGPFAWVPGMECYHGVVSLDHAISGSLELNGEKISFDGGRGYIEKDWGKAMPKAWIWMQSNHFSSVGTSLTASIASIPWIGFSFTGFIVGFLSDGNLHRFATYNGSKIEKAVVDENNVKLVFSNRREKLVISGSRSKGSSLQAPTFQQMDRRIQETLSASLHVQLFSREYDSWEKVFDEIGKWAGLEIVGELPI